MHANVSGDASSAVHREIRRVRPAWEDAWQRASKRERALIERDMTAMDAVGDSDLRSWVLRSRRLVPGAFLGLLETEWITESRLLPVRDDPVPSTTGGLPLFVLSARGPHVRISTLDGTVHPEKTRRSVE